MITRLKPTMLKLISPAVHSITPPHIGSSEKYASFEYRLPVIKNMRQAVKSGDAAVTIWAKDTKMYCNAMLPHATDAQNAYESVCTFSIVDLDADCGSEERCAQQQHV
eukprot:4648543-Pleurochrysis_carterae.AAC.5